MNLNQFFNSWKDYGVIFLRLVIGCRLIVAVWSVVFSWQNMPGVKDFFQSVHIPMPMISAVVAVYAEFICGILYIIGLWVRQAALIMIINFIVAIAFVDVHN
ncbi:MAG: DoxX family protein, partial [Bacteroidota bacterium]|nr:DoxX family protein [Bacteroidota bacterium]